MTTAGASGAASLPQGRYVALDAFRGFVIAGMLLVNNVVWNASTPKQLMHAAWNQGVTFTDMIFPWFLFAMGVAIPFSAASARARGVGTWAYAWRVVRRSAVLVVLGLVVDSAVSRRLYLGLGVLQLLGLAYLAGALVGRSPLWVRLTVAGALLVGHWALLRFVPIPGVGAGVFEETENIIRYLNAAYLAQVRLNGIISAGPTAALVLLGTAAGEVLRAAALAPGRRLAILGAAGTAAAVLGWVWQIDLPFNKPVWTASYILFGGGLGCLLLGLSYLLFDLLPLRRLAFPLAVFGANAIVVYVASILVKVSVLQVWQHPSAQGKLVTLERALLDALSARYGAVHGGWVYTIGYILVWWLVALYLYERRIFIRV
jgi:predicted acyltransferase